jgi:hypothetical protein
MRLVNLRSEKDLKLDESWWRCDKKDVEGAWKIDLV